MSVNERTRNISDFFLTAHSETTRNVQEREPGRTRNSSFVTGEKYKAYLQISILREMDLNKLEILLWYGVSTTGEKKS